MRRTMNKPVTVIFDRDSWYIVISKAIREPVGSLYSLLIKQRTIP